MKLKQSDTNHIMLEDMLFHKHFHQKSVVHQMIYELWHENIFSNILDVDGLIVMNSTEVTVSFTLFKFERISYRKRKFRTDSFCSILLVFLCFNIFFNEIICTKIKSFLKKKYIQIIKPNIANVEGITLIWKIKYADYQTQG